MSKKQLLVLALVASIPAAGLLVKMLFSLLHLLSDQSSASVLLWIIFVVCLLGSAFIAFLPMLLWLYYPATGFANAAATNTGVQGSGTDFGGEAVVEDDEDAFEEEDSPSQHAVVDEGESLFDQEVIGDDFDDDFDGEFEDDEFEDGNEKQQ